MRRTEFAKNKSLDNFLSDLNKNLWISEREVLAEIDPTLDKPLLLVMGAMRSGSTLFMQWLAQTGVVGYPTNLLSRFYRAPIVGSKIQLLLTEEKYQFRNELSGIDRNIKLESVNGKTDGLLSPNEFWYFWRRFLRNPEKEVWSEQELIEELDVGTLRRELAGIILVHDKPFAAKGMIFNYHVPLLFRELKNVVFVHLSRDLEANARSVMKARLRQFGDETEWYSFKIPEYDELRHLVAEEQIKGQISAINAAVASGFQTLPTENKLSIQYEDFCERPGYWFQQITELLGIEGTQYEGPRSFTVSR